MKHLQMDVPTAEAREDAPAAFEGFAAVGHDEGAEAIDTHSGDGRFQWNDALPRKVLVPLGRLPFTYAAGDAVPKQFVDEWPANYYPVALPGTPEYALSLPECPATSSWVSQTMNIVTG